MDEINGPLGEDICEVAAVPLSLRAIDVEVIIVVVRVSSGEANELLEATGVRVEAGIERAVVPFPDQARPVAPGSKDISDSSLTERDAVEPAAVEGVDRPGTMRVLARKKARPRWSANRGSRVMMGQADTLVGESVKVRGPAAALIEQAEVAITHVVSNNQDVIELSHFLPCRLGQASCPGGDPGQGEPNVDQAK